MTRLLGPVGPSSRLRRRPDVAYTEVDRCPVLCDPVSRSLHELSPAAAALWGQLDGRRLDALGADDIGRWSDLEVVELVRRLRVLDLVDDVRELDDATDDSHATGDSHATPVPGAESVELAGRTDEVAGNLVVVLSSWPGPGSIHYEADASSVAGAGPVRALAVMDPSGEPGRTPPVDALRVIIGAAAPSTLVAGPLDVLAGMAETIPLLRIPDRSALDALGGDFER